MTDEAKALVERLRNYAEWVEPEYDYAEAPTLTAAADLIETQAREIERLREALVMSVADMMRASGRLDVIAGCNEDRRIANALKGTCDFARAALGESHD